MSDIRNGMANDPNFEPLTKPDSILRPATPPGSELKLHDDGTATFMLGDEEEKADQGGHFENLAEVVEPYRLNVIAQDLLDAIDIDIDAHRKRDQKYAENLRRTGLGDDAPGGAPFAGASRAVHPMLTEAVIDYAARVCGEMLPPEGPVKAHIVGTPTADKQSRGERVARYMNLQFTELMPSAADEIEVGYSQQGLEGAFYLKPSVRDGRPDLEVVYADKVHAPWKGGNFYTQARITHEMEVSRQEYEDNVSGELWIDVLEPSTASDNIEQSSPSQANDRIIGRDQPVQNIDDIRTVYEISTRLALEGDDDEVMPYLVTIDEQTRKILAIYRNWKEEDANHFRLDFLIEFPFWLWRDGPIGLGHMIGSLSGAASGALRAMLDSALLNAMQTGVKLKGGTTSGGQNIRVNPGSTAEVQGSLAQEPDIRKTYMPLPFPPPSEVLFKLLGFLIDTGRSVVRTTFDEFNKMNGETPVGTANMMIEQGLKTFGYIFGRQHRAMKRLLRMLWYINQKTVENEEVVDDFGELIVSKEDFAGPMVVVPVSDPRVFTDAQRQASAQLIAARSDSFTAMKVPSPYKTRAVEMNVMRANKIPSPEQYLQDAPEPQQLNAAAENVAATQGLPIKPFPGQDHEAHIAIHASFMDSPLWGSNPVLALKFLPAMLQHIADHMALWYADAMLLSTNTLLEHSFKDPRITLEALQTVDGLQAPLDKLMAEITPTVMQHGSEALNDVMPILAKAQALVKQLQPPTPMDPSIVAQQDVQRQQKADDAAAELKKAELQRKAAQDQGDSARKDAETQHDMQLEQQQQQQDAADTADDREQQAQESERQAAIAAAGVEATTRGQDVQAATAHDQSQSQEDVAAHRDETQLEITERDNETAKEIAHISAKAKKGTGNLKDGAGLRK